MTVDIGWPLAIALILLIGIGVAASVLSRIGVERQIAWAALRAILQLTGVSFLLVLALGKTLYAVGFVAVMFSIGVYTTAKRTGIWRSGAWPWAALAMGAGTAPVLVVVFGLGVAPTNPAGIIPIASIIVGNMMTAHTLVGRRSFAELRTGIPTYEAALSIGLTRSDAVAMVTRPTLKEAMIPTLDQTRTVGLVTLPGAFIGVLLGGGSPLQAGAAQVLVLTGVLAGQSCTIAVADQFMRRGLLLPPDLRKQLHP